MIETGETGMLYFLYSSNLISVLVCHDLKLGEFVLQIPYYPPTQNLSDFTEQVCMEKIKQCFSSDDLNENIDIKAMNTWRMEAIISDKT